MIRSQLSASFGKLFLAPPLNSRTRGSFVFNWSAQHPWSSLSTKSFTKEFSFSLSRRHFSRTKREPFLRQTFSYCKCALWTAVLPASPNPQRAAENYFFWADQSRSVLHISGQRKVINICLVSAKVRDAVWTLTEKYTAAKVSWIH